MIEVIGAGLGRTGTSSLRIALERLGFAPCYHMFEVVGSRARMEQWTRRAESDAPGWDEIFAGYRACVDFPAAAYWRELTAHYPEAKVILTLRDPDEWYASARRTIFRLPMLLRHPVAGPGLRFVLPLWPALAEFVRMLETLNRDRRDIDFAREASIAFFERHNAAVMKGVAEDRLLVYRIRDGWDSLCEFLDVAVPPEPFPWANDTATFWRDFRRTLRTA
ncbi:sulfotransferase family protein [Spirillospora albida]|uniref:sulfotransferase family protein n=1 Tax=Spirillospora albida TaxID=58123 RepID=UPI0004BF1E0A|nr:sulfotransferase family protein [Spirillospora albida]